MTYPKHLERVIELLKKLPGVGAKSAERFAFELVGWEPRSLRELGEAVAAIPEKLSTCPSCFSLMGGDGCAHCDLTRRDASTLCVVAWPKDVFAIESTSQFKGLYHCLGGHFSPIEGRSPGDLNLGALIERLEKLKVEEVIVALDATLDGDATALLVTEKLSRLNLKISRIAFGLPMGSPLEYIDRGTLARALDGRIPC